MQKNGSIGIYYQSQKRPKTAVENALKCDRGIFYRYSQAFCRDRSPLGQFPKKGGKGGKNWDRGIFYRQSQAKKMGKGYKYLEQYERHKSCGKQPLFPKKWERGGQKNCP